MAINSTDGSIINLDTTIFAKSENPCPVEETLTINTPYGEVSGPESAVKYIQELIDEDTKPPFFY